MDDAPHSDKDIWEIKNCKIICNILKIVNFKIRKNVHLSGGNDYSQSSFAYPTEHLPYTIRREGSINLLKILRKIETICVIPLVKISQLQVVSLSFTYTALVQTSLTNDTSSTLAYTNKRQRRTSIVC